MTHKLNNNFQKLVDQPSRRHFLKKSGSMGATLPFLTTGLGTGFFADLLQGQNPGNKPSARPYLFTICAAGGASIIDSFLAQAGGPAGYPNLVKSPGSQLSAVPVLKNSIQGQIPLGNGYAQSTFLTKHGADIAIMTCEVSSVNHQVAAKRAVTGDNVNGGRTIQEAVSLKYGEGLPIANLMLAGGGYASRGDDITLPEWARGQLISDPLMFAFATHGSKGVTQNLSTGEISQIRKLRQQLEIQSMTINNLKQEKILQNYLANRERAVDMLEKGDAITKLMMVDPVTNNLQSFGLQASADFMTIQEKFPQLATDPYESRMAMAYLAVKHQISTCVTLAPPPAPLISAQGSPNSPIAFDWSHVDHRGAQNTMWSFILKSVDGLIDLLKATPDPSDPQKKMWDRSLIYIATEFGRDKVSTGGSGHHLNNGVVMISPLLEGNRVFGDVDPNTGLTFGFNPNTGDPMPGTKMTERDVYCALATALDIDFNGRKNITSMVRKRAS